MPSARYKLRVEEVASMIRFSLRCASGHEFEAWFRNGDGYEAQQNAGEIACPECGDTHVEKALMAPSIGRSREGRSSKCAARSKAIAIMSVRNSLRRRGASIMARAIRAAFSARRPRVSRA